MERKDFNGVFHKFIIKEISPTRLFFLAGYIIAPQ